MLESELPVTPELPMVCSRDRRGIPSQLLFRANPISCPIQAFHTHVSHPLGPVLVATRMHILVVAQCPNAERTPSVRGRESVPARRVKKRRYHRDPDKAW
jgi:hypothetical protein